MVVPCIVTTDDETSLSGLGVRPPIVSCLIFMVGTLYPGAA